jgi:hypothetical protein
VGPLDGFAFGQGVEQSVFIPSFQGAFQQQLARLRQVTILNGLSHFG